MDTCGRVKPRRMKAEREDLEDNKTCTNDTLALQVVLLCVRESTLSWHMLCCSCSEHG